MRRTLRLTGGCAVLGVLAFFAVGQETAAPPAARRVPFEETFHGVTLTDRYHWLKDFDSADASAFIEAQDRFARARLARAPGQD
jgi:hypothetical protein